MTFPFLASVIASSFVDLLRWHHCLHRQLADRSVNIGLSNDVGEEWVVWFELFIELLKEAGSTKEAGSN